MTSRYLPKVLFAVFLCASPVDVSARVVLVPECAPHQSVWMPTPEELVKFKTETTKDRPNFCKADLRGADLTKADLSGAKLSGANLRGAHLNDAMLRGADIRRADLNDANLSGANLSYANLVRANLSGANLDGANLTHADLSSANLDGANLKDTRISYAILGNAFYAPVSEPPNSFVAGIKGLETVRFTREIGGGTETGLVQLRDLLQKSGLREDERKLTYALERGRTDRALNAWEQEFPRAAEGVFRVIAFDWTTAYGLHPARALGVLLLVWALLIPVYWWPIRRQSPTSTAAIFRIWPKDRIELKKSSTFLPGNEREPKVGEPILQKDGKVERLQARSLMAIAWAAWFSLLSAFQIGFREFSVGNWLTRVHPRQFTLEPTGWVRTVAGAQSLLSVYLLAMWVLTYFGRPFQ